MSPGWVLAGAVGIVVALAVLAGVVIGVLEGLGELSRKKGG